MNNVSQRVTVYDNSSCLVAAQGVAVDMHPDQPLGSDSPWGPCDMLVRLFVRAALACGYAEQTVHDAVCGLADEIEDTRRKDESDDATHTL